MMTLGTNEYADLVKKHWWHMITLSLPEVFEVTRFQVFFACQRQSRIRKEGDNNIGLSRNRNHAWGQKICFSSRENEMLDEIFWHCNAIHHLRHMKSFGAYWRDQ
jgi:hypothetical protein